MSDPRIDVSIGANVQKFTAGIDAATATLQRFVSLGAFAALARSAINLGGALSDMAAQNQVNVGWLQEVGYAAAQTGSSVEDLTGALTELRRAQAQALGGSRSDTKMFSDLGISLEELRTFGVEELFDRIAESVRRSGGAIREVNAAIAVLGRGGRSMLAGMTQGFGDLREEARRFGMVMDQGMIDSMDRMGDWWGRTWLRMQVAAANVLETVVSLVDGNFETLNRKFTFFSRILEGGAAGLAAGLRDGVQALTASGNVSASWDVAKASARRAAVEQWQYRPPSPYMYSRPAEPGGSGLPPELLRDGGRRPERQASPSDPLKRIGLYLGGSGLGSGDALLRTQTSALETLRKIQRTLDRQGSRRNLNFSDFSL